MSESAKHLVTEDRGITFVEMATPTIPSMFGVQSIQSNPKDYQKLLYIGSRNCDTPSSDCHAELFYSSDKGQTWQAIASYVRGCSWAITTEFNAGDDAIICEIYQDRVGDQRTFHSASMNFVISRDFFATSSVLFRDIIGFVISRNYLIVAQVYFVMFNI